MDLAENRPFESGSQTNLSCLCDIGIGMLRMTLASQHVILIVIGKKM